MGTSKYRLRKEIKAMQWDGSVDGAYDLFDFVADTECQIQDDGSLLLRCEDGEDEWVPVQPGDWIVLQRLGCYIACTDDYFRRNFEAIEPAVAGG